MIVVSLTAVFGQQDPQYTQYMYNQNILNPAYAGSKGILSLGLLGRTQWIGINGSPETLTLSLHSPISNTIGLGFSVIHDEIGPAKEDNVYADFSYTIHTSDEGNLAFGLKAGFTSLNIRSFFNIVDQGDTILITAVNKTSPNFGAGIYYYTQKFYAGVSIPNFIETKHLDKSSTSYASEKAHYFLTTGFLFNLKDNLKLKPSLMIKTTSGARISIDVSTNIFINDKFEIGLSYRLNDSVSAIIGFNVTDDMRIGYAYDYTTSYLGKFNSGSHEILLIYEFKILKSRLKSPRYF